MTSASSAMRALRAPHPVEVFVEPSLTFRNRLTCAFRPILAIPHLILVGGPVAFAFTWLARTAGTRNEWGGGGGLLGVVAVAIAVIAWFAILFTGRFPAGLWKLSSYYMKWRVRAVSYVALLRDEYPPFGDGTYPASVDLPRPEGERNRLTVAFRPILGLPHLLVLWVVGLVWVMTTIIAWFFVVFTGRYPNDLYDIAVGSLRYSTRVEAYMLLLRDEYPPFPFEAEAA